MADFADEKNIKELRVKEKLTFCKPRKRFLKSTQNFYKKFYSFVLSNLITLVHPTQ